MELEEILNAYERKFQQFSVEGNITGYYGACIADVIRNAKAGNIPDYKLLHQSIGYETSLLKNASFKNIDINQHNLPVILLIKDFLELVINIGQVNANVETKKTLNLLAGYKSESIELSLTNYKNKLLTVENQQKAKQSLIVFLQTLNQLVLKDIIDHQEKLYRATLIRKDKEYGVSQFFGQAFTENAIGTISDALSYSHFNEEFSFLSQLKKVIDKVPLTYRDISQLHLSSKQFERATLKINSVQEVKRYHWLINILCNLLNTFGVIVESDKSKQIKSAFTLFQTWIDTSEKSVKKVEQHVSTFTPNLYK